MKRYKMKNVLRVIGDIFIPLLPGIICAGLCGGAVSLITQMVPHYQDNNVWAFIHQILSLINTSMMTYLTAWAGYRAAERFGGTPILEDGMRLVSTQFNAREAQWQEVLCGGEET